MPKCRDSVNARNHHLLTVAFREFRYGLFRTCELMQHVDSVLFSGHDLYNVAIQSSRIERVGNTWRIRYK